MAKRQKREVGITGRWVLGSLSWIVLIIIGAVVVSYYGLRAYYYSAARQIVEYHLRNAVQTIETSSGTGKGRYEAALQYVENFTEKDRFEVMLLDVNGYVVVTSSGFEYWSEDPVPEYSAAVASDEGIGSEIVFTQRDEKCIAMTGTIPAYAQSISAVRIVSSLVNIDSMIGNIELVLLGVGIVILLFSILSGAYFVRSIVQPIQSIENAASKIATGDFDAKIESDYRDEIGKLSETINKMADGLASTEKMKSDFISSVSHELRTPLTSIRGWGETLKNIDPSDTQTFDKGMDIILRETDRLSTMVEDLLDFSRIESGGFTYSKEIIDLGAEVTDAVIMVEQRAKASGISIEFSEPSESIPVMGDSNRLRQVFINILDNAIKYTSEGGTIKVDTSVKNGKARVTIRDNGKGIPRDEIDKIKEKFYKASNSVKGSGIGLAVVDEIVSAHGGEFNIDSKLGEYTEAEIVLPLSGTGNE
ncbi:MAG: HAMP domain-containing histidine kinase [Oscillospiraceae bacterium]|nr:HAMP domain-containing histidine kinase [Oscillospiraceae bacterium]